MPLQVIDIMFAYISTDLPNSNAKRVHKKNKQFVTPRPRTGVKVLKCDYASVAQLADAVGSNPTFYEFESHQKYYGAFDKWFKSSALHAGVTGSSPVRAIGEWVSHQ